MFQNKTIFVKCIKFMLGAFIFSMFPGCVSTSKIPAKPLSLESGLVSESDYIEIVYEDGVFSYVSYLKTEDLREDPREGLRKEPCDEAGQNQSTYSLGIWIWDYRGIVGNEKDVIERLLKRNIKRIYIQIGRDIEVLKPFLKEAKARGFTIFALDGSPEYIDNHQGLIDNLNRLKEFNKINKAAGFDGFQIDVEPYLKKDFNLKKEYYLRMYISMAMELKHLAGEDLKISLVLPFWYDKFIIDGKRFSSQIIDIADEIVLMSYRTDYDEIVESARNELCYAGNINKPVFLGIEINRIPYEEHFIIDKRDIVRLAGVSGDKLILQKNPEGLPVFRRYEVDPGRITFYEKRDSLQSIINRRVPYNSFSGYIIHSYGDFFE